MPANARALAAGAVKTASAGFGKTLGLEDIRQILRDQMPVLRQRYGVHSLAVFGSRVRADFRPDSDLDMLVELDEGRITLLEFVELEQHLSDLLGIKVDLVEQKVLKPPIGPRILAEAVPV